MPTDEANLGEGFGAGLTVMARRRPQEIALICPKLFSNKPDAPEYTFAELEEESDLLARGLRECGIGEGARIMFMVNPGFSFLTLAYAIFKVGAVLVGVDPGMGRRNLEQCLEEANPSGFIGMPIVHRLQRMFGWAAGSIEVSITTADESPARRGLIGLSELRELGRRSNSPLPQVRGSDPAIIAFTSGSTGTPKGVVYTHALLNAQMASLRDHFGMEEGERDLVTFPHFALFGPGLGMTLVLARMDFRRPGRAIPSVILQSLKDHRITSLFGSPALLSRVGEYGRKRGIRLPALRRVVCAGAPVPGRVVRDVWSMLMDGEFHTPYGATEALPVTSISGREIMTETQALTDLGRGVCVGKPMEGLDVRIITLRDDAIETWCDDLELAAGEIGEIAVSGPVVSPEYFGRPGQTVLAKIRRGDGFYHRMGDLGYFDEQGRLWFCGRKSQRVTTPDGDLFTIPVESVFNTHPQVLRSALVGVGSRDDQRPVLCVQLVRPVTQRRWRVIREELLEMAAARPETSSIREILKHARFPVDVRHNAKIGREKLAAWAGGKQS